MRYQIKHATVKYAADTILTDADFEIRDNEKIAVVGRNGCGKTTLLKLIAGMIEMSNPDSDEECGISMAGTQRIGYLKQTSFADTGITAQDEIVKVFEPVFRLAERMRGLEARMAKEAGEEVLREYALVQNEYEMLGGYTYRKDMETIFQSFGFTLEDMQKTLGSFSGGQQTKIAFVKLLLSKPDIMLLDEPTNHLDMPTIEWLEGYLKNYKKAVVIVSHDRMFLEHIADVVYEIEYHKIKRYPGNYSAYVERKRLDAEKQEKDYEAQQAEIRRLTDWIEKWKNTPTKVAATRSKRMVIEHMEKIEKPRRFDTKSFHAQCKPKIESHKKVIEASKLQIGYGKTLSEVTFLLQKGERLAVIGENGKGKSTLLKTLTGEIPALGGSFQLGTNVEYVYFDQQSALLESKSSDTTILEDFWQEYPNMLQGEVRQALGNFLFSQEEVYKPLWQLSGGEKVRLALCKLFWKRPNLLILDEPTNHMDIVGKEALESMLKAYTGTVLFVSHDRYFIRETATNILDFQKDKTVFYACGYEEYLETAARAARMEEEKKQPGKRENSKKATQPTLTDVFDKKTYYNPGKVEARRRQQIKKYEQQLTESEERLQVYRLELVNPKIASNYEKLTELDTKIQEEEALQDNLLNWLTELETEGLRQHDM